MTLHTAIEGVVHSLRETLLDMQHLTFCLLLGLLLFTSRHSSRDVWMYSLALLPGFLLERSVPAPPLLVNVAVALTVCGSLFLQWFYEKMAAYTLPFLAGSGLVHGMSLSKAAAGSSHVAFVSYALSVILVQALTIWAFGTLARSLSSRSPDAFEGLENILCSVGAGVALAFFVMAF